MVGFPAHHVTPPLVRHLVHSRNVVELARLSGVLQPETVARGCVKQRIIREEDKGRPALREAADGLIGYRDRLERQGSEVVFKQLEGLVAFGRRILSIAGRVEAAAHDARLCFNALRAIRPLAQVRHVHHG